MLRRPVSLRLRRSATDGSHDPQPVEDSAEDTAVPETGGKSAATTAGKGRPTPKRSESEKRRRQPYIAPKDRKEASRASRGGSREDRSRRLEAMRRGEDWALTARDRGKVRALVRDYVDSRRRIGEFYMPSLLVLLVLVFIHVTFVANALVFLVLGGGLILITEGILVGRRARTLAEQRFPGESTRGIRWYAAMRTLQIRRMRTPKPRVSPGGEF